MWPLTNHFKPYVIELPNEGSGGREFKVISTPVGMERLVRKLNDGLNKQPLSVSSATVCIFHEPVATVTPGNSDALLSFCFIADSPQPDAPVSCPGNKYLFGREDLLEIDDYILTCSRAQMNDLADRLSAALSVSTAKLQGRENPQEKVIELLNEEVISEGLPAKLAFSVTRNLKPYHAGWKTAFVASWALLLVALTLLGLGLYYKLMDFFNS